MNHVIRLAVNGKIAHKGLVPRLLQPMVVSPQDLQGRINYFLLLYGPKIVLCIGGR